MVKFDLSLQECDEFKEIFNKAICVGVVKQVVDALNKNHEYPMYFFKKLFFFWGLPSPFKRLIVFLMRNLMSTRAADQMKCFRHFSTDEIDEIHRARDKF